MIILKDANSATYAFEQKMNIFEERAQKYNNRVEKKKLEEE
jgi:hypothetical protein